MIAEHDGEWHCKTCGEVDPTKIRIYHPEGFFNARSLRVGPWCAVCGNRLIWTTTCSRRFNQHADSNGRVLLISGSCASGKTTISFLMAKQIDAVQIDGDWILSLRKKELGRNVDFKEIDADIAEMADGFIQLGKNVIIAQVILPDNLPVYENFFAEKGIPFRFVVLMPSESILLYRNETRICWPTTTPEYWVRKFHDDLLNAPEPFQRVFYDNSRENPEQTAANLVKTHFIN